MHEDHSRTMCPKSVFLMKDPKIQIRHCSIYRALWAKHLPTSVHMDTVRPEMCLVPQDYASKANPVLCCMEFALFARLLASSFQFAPPKNGATTIRQPKKL